MPTHRVQAAAEGMPSDPMRILTENLDSLLARQMGLPAAESDHLGQTDIAELYREFWHATPATTSKEGAAGALRAMVKFGDMEDGDISVISSVLTFLEEEPAVSFTADPILVLIAEYRRQLALFNTYPDDWTSKQADAFADETFEPCLSQLENDTPVIMTEKGAVEAIRLALEEPPASGMAKSILAAALTYFDGRA